MTRVTPHGRRRKSGRRGPSAVVENDPSADTKLSTPYLPDANPPQKRPGLLLLAGLLWTLCVAALLYMVQTGP